MLDYSKDIKLCICQEDKIFQENGFTAKKGKIYHFYVHSKDTIAIYGKNNNNIYGVSFTLFEKHFKLKNEAAHATELPKTK